MRGKQDDIGVADVFFQVVFRAFVVGDFDDIKESFALAADRQVVIPDVYLNYFDFL